MLHPDDIRPLVYVVLFYIAIAGLFIHLWLTWR